MLWVVIVLIKARIVILCVAIDRRRSSVGVSNARVEGVNLVPDLLPDILPGRHVTAHGVPDIRGPALVRVPGNQEAPVSEVIHETDNPAGILLGEVEDNRPNPRINPSMVLQLTVSIHGLLYVPITCGTGVRDVKALVRSIILRLVCLIESVDALLEAIAVIVMLVKGHVLLFHRAQVQEGARDPVLDLLPRAAAVRENKRRLDPAAPARRVIRTRRRRRRAPRCLVGITEY